MQHKMKNKVKLPAGVEKKKGGGASSKKRQATAKLPKKGTHVAIAPKRKAAMEKVKQAMIISKTINERNEKSIKGRANADVGKTTA